MEQSDLYLLQHVPSYHLQAVSRTRHLSLPVPAQGTKSTGDSSLIDPGKVRDLGEQLFDPTACREVIRGLEAPDLLILQELTSCGGRANSRDLALYMSSTSPATSHTSSTPHAPQYPTPHPHGAYEQAVHRLLALRLLFWGKQTSFSGRDYANGVYDGVLIVPQTIMEAVQSIEQSARVDRGPQSKNQEMRYSEESQSNEEALLSDELHKLQRTLYLYWSLAAAQRDGLPLVSSKLLSRPALRQVVEQLTTLNVEQIRIEADLPRLLFMRLLMTRMGLLYERNGSVYPASAENAEEYFALPLAERARRCYRVWLETPFWNELNYLPGVLLRPTPGPTDTAHAELARAREMVIEQILQARVGTAQALVTFIARAKLHKPYLLFPRDYGARTERYSIGSNPYGLDFRLKHGWLTHREGWYLVEGGFIRAVLSGPLRWLGLVDVDEDADTFTPLPSLAPIAGNGGEWTRDDVPEVWGKLVVQPNFEMVALAPVSEALLLRLDRFAERVRLEQIAQYRLTRASVTHAVQLGITAEEMLQLLEQHAGDTIPQNVYYSLKEWERYARRVELWTRMALIEVENEAMLDTFYEDETLRPFIGQRLSPTLAEVAADQLQPLQERLWERDLLPSLVSAPLYRNVLESNGRMPPKRRSGACWRRD